MDYYDYQDLSEIEYQPIYSEVCENRFREHKQKKHIIKEMRKVLKKISEAIFKKKIKKQKALN
ncbi:unnamed protein product [marine sediment metagenome]|uniref:Uncharacterized protein n=1 Tax=marine sediment metagenome TaxID=412755 RepID=X0SUN6_9ZZZZ